MLNATSVGHEVVLCHELIASDAVAIERAQNPIHSVINLVEGERLSQHPGGVEGTVRAKDSVIVVTWKLGTATLDTGFRADETAAHGTVLDGLVAIAATSSGTGEL